MLDTSPALGYLTVNALAAGDILLVPLGASFLELDSTKRFFDMLYATFNSIEEGENAAARAHGLTETHFAWDASRGVLTRDTASQRVKLSNVIQAYINEFTAAHSKDYNAHVGQAGEQVDAIVEAVPRRFCRERSMRMQDV